MRPRWLVILYLGVQVVVPMLMLMLRWALNGATTCLGFGWQMYACG